MNGSNTEHEIFGDPAFVERLRTGEAEAIQAATTFQAISREGSPFW